MDNNLEELEKMADLVCKRLQHEITDDEQRSLDRWMALSDENRAFVSRIDDQQLLQKALSMMHEVELEKGDIFRSVAERYMPDKRVVSINKKHLFRYAAAAALLFVVCSLWFVVGRRPVEKPMVVVTPPIKQDVLPGKDGAILTLADGSQLVLDTVNNGSITRQGNVAIVKNGNQLAYSPSTGGNYGEATFNSIATPRGYQYQVVLPDGSHVWLNADSKLRYPTVFNEKERRVELTGEAYFEVRHTTAPFIVKIINAAGDGGEVEVLGTHFNITAYNDEPITRTTLLEGKVKVSTKYEVRNTNENTILFPGEQASWNQQTSSIRVVRSDNASESISWTRGIFHFEKSNLDQVMRQLARWYDVTIIYSGKPGEQTITGDVERTIPLSELLSNLEKMTRATFQLEGRTVKVTL